MIRNALIALCGLAVTMPAMAQDTRLGSRLQKRVESGAQRDGADAVRTAHRLAQCLYDRRTADAVNYLGTLSPADEERLRQKLFKTVECRNLMLIDSTRMEGVAVRTPRDIMRGMMAEAALGKIAQDDTLQPLPAQQSYNRDWFPVSGRDATANEMATCVADQNPGGITALLNTCPESAEELAAARALAPSLGPCLPQGAILKANRQSLRAALAEALFHRATAPALATTN